MAQREITEADIDAAIARPEAQYRAKAHSDRTVTYVRLSEAPVARTLLHISDVILVDVDDYGTPVGVEVVAPLDTIEQEDWYALAKVVPAVKQIFKEYFPPNQS